MTAHTSRPRDTQMPAIRTVMMVWVAVGLGPLFLQLRGFAKFVAPHKISEQLVIPMDGLLEKENVEILCPVQSMFIAGARWSIVPTHYYRGKYGLLCHVVGPQYNVHGNYIVGNHTSPSNGSAESCEEQRYDFLGNFYHGSIGYYAIYAEAVGTYCEVDKQAHIVVQGTGTYDINGPRLAKDRGSAYYRMSYWYIVTGITFILLRLFTIRRGFVSCRRFARRCDQMADPVRVQEAVVYVQESLRLTAHGAKNFHRVVILFLLLDQGVMTDFFLLSTQGGWFGRVQSISLGYNLSSVMSMLFEMVEVKKWLRKKSQCQMRRLLFNYETALVGEFITAAVLLHYLTALSKSKLKDSEPVAEAVSYYIMGLMGHVVIALGCLFIIISTRTLGAIGFVLLKFGTFRVLMTPCAVDDALGVRSKLTLLNGYIWHEDKLFYRPNALKAFGLYKLVEDDGAEYMVHAKIHWIAVPKLNLVILGTVSDNGVEPCPERPSSGAVSLFNRALGGTTLGNGPPNSVTPFAGPALNRIKVHHLQNVRPMRHDQVSPRSPRFTPRSPRIIKDATDVEIQQL